jgi:hypothetical protein
MSMDLAGPTIRRQLGLDLLKAYMHERFRWTNDMLVSVNWEAFSCAFCSRYRFSVFTFKLCFWQLPTGKTLHKRSPQFDPKCPACSHASECNDHMFQCKAIFRRQWKSSFIQSTHKRAEDCKIDPKLIHILFAGIQSYFDSCRPPHSEFADYLQTYRQLAIAQTTVGWAKSPPHGRQSNKITCTVPTSRSSLIPTHGIKNSFIPCSSAATLRGPSELANDMAQTRKPNASTD